MVESVTELQDMVLKLIEKKNGTVGDIRQETDILKSTILNMLITLKTRGLVRKVVRKDGINEWSTAPGKEWEVKEARKKKKRRRSSGSTKIKHIMERKGPRDRKKKVV